MIANVRQSSAAEFALFVAGATQLLLFSPLLEIGEGKRAARGWGQALPLRDHDAGFTAFSFRFYNTRHSPHHDHRETHGKTA